MVLQRVCMALILTVSLAAAALAAVDKGAESISLDGGSRGRVPFPHHRHQGALKDCRVCHDLFPQEKDSIHKLKGEGHLVSKQVMNKLCITCHKAEEKAGKPSGPKTCAQCHVRE